MRKLVVAAVALGSMWVVPAAQAAIPSVFGGALTCSVAADNVRECGSSSPRSTVPTFDGVPLDINVAFPPDPGAGDGNFPLIMWGHGYGGAKIGFGASGSTTAGMRRFTSRGFAVMSMTTRGFRESCGSSGVGSSQEAGGAACDNGYVRLMDTRYEVRDYQHLAATLADEDVIDPQRIGATGGSYGGGLSMALAALKNRVMMPDGSLVPWVSPVDAESLRIAGATPSIPWTDLTYSLVPNGRTLDYVTDGTPTGPIGVMKQSLVNGLYFSGAAAPGFYSDQPPSPAPDPDADLTSWLTELQAGEPYDGDPMVEDIVQEIRTHHSSYFIDHSTAPAPLLMSSGFTDDLFPADETIRFYNRTKEEHPSTPMSLFFGNFGHQRAANRSADGAVLTARENAWLDYYVKGTGPQPFQGVESTTQVCPNASPSEGPFQAANWARSAPGEIRFNDNAAKTISTSGGDPILDAFFNPTANTGNPCGTAIATDQPGTATYRLPKVSAPGYVQVGSPTVIAKIGSPGPHSEIAARLFDVAPNGQETLVDRAVYRPVPGNTSRQVFQLHPNAYRWAAGHIPKLELLPDDAGGGALSSYVRPANGQTAITVDDLQLRIPVLEKPGAQKGLVKAHAAYVVPTGMKLAKDFVGGVNASVKKGKLKANEKVIKGLKLGAPADWEAAHAKIQVIGAGGKLAADSKKKKKKGSKALATGKVTITGGKVKKVRLSLTKKGKKKLGGRHGKLRVKVIVTTTEQEGKVKVKRKLLVS